MTSFKVPCPSCEAKVLIKNLNAIGTKVECPKCKYRFKVEEPKDGAAEPAAEAPAAVEKKGGGKGKKKLVAAVLAVLGIGLLAIGGYAIFGGDGGKKPNKSSSSSSGGGGYTPPNPNQNGGPGTGTEDPKDKKDDKKDIKKPSDVPYSDKDATNLLPGAAVAVYRFDIEKLRLTPIGNALFDDSTGNVFKNSFGAAPQSKVHVSNVEKYFHCIVGEKDRAPIGLLKWKDPVAEKEFAIVGAGQPKDVNKYKLIPVNGNPFISAVSQSLSGRSLFADVYATGISAPAKPISYAVCIYDTQHLFVGEAAALEKFLGGLKNGYPEFQTVFQKVESPVPSAPTTPMPMGGPGTAVGMLPLPGGLPPTTPPPATPAPPTTPPAAGGNKTYTSNPSYLSVTADLKRLLNVMEDEPGGAPIIAMAEKFDSPVYPRSGVKRDYAGIAMLLDPVLDRTAYVGLNLNNFTTRQCSMTVRLIGKSAEAAKQIALEQLTPALNDGTPILSLLLDTQFVLKNYADPNAMIPGGTNTPGGNNGPLAPPPPGAGGNSGSAPPPPMPPPGVGGSSGGPPPGLPRGGPGPMGPGGAAGSAPGLPPPPGGNPGAPIGSPGSGGPGAPPMFPGAGGPGFPGAPMMPPTNPANPESPIELRLVDSTVTLTVTINWTDEVYGRFVVPRVFGFANQVKGKTSVYARGSSGGGLSAAVQAYVKANDRFPAATIPRPPADSSRLGLNYPPMQRLSFFAELLPFVGRANLSQTLVPGAAWFDPANSSAVDSWVPEFLVPYYDQSAWRASSTLAPDRVLGGTNFVAIAGVGRDAARYDPQNPATAKAIGLSGYDWGAKVADVTDGLANTIFLLQTPPQMNRPWAAGGGATALGLNPEDPIADFKHQRPDGQWGTYAIMGDGAVRWIPANIKPADLLALATRAGGEKLSGALDAIAPRADGKPSELRTEVKPDPMPLVPSKTPEPKAGPAAALEIAPAPRGK